VRALHLEVDHTNEAARRLYRRWGFVEHDRYLMTRRVPPA
jgi:ribosomal protein S18 acetylase RimI-like enzyme